MKKLKVYVAGPDVFLRDPIGLAERKKAICAKIGFQGISPMDNELPREDLSKLDFAISISRGNETLMDGCDLIIANMTPFRGPSLDAGTSFEMGYMRGQGKLVFGYTNSSKLYFERVMEFYSRELKLREDSEKFEDPNHMEVENYGLIDNLMLEGAVRGKRWTPIAGQLGGDC